MFRKLFFPFSILLLGTLGLLLFPENVWYFKLIDIVDIFATIFWLGSTWFTTSIIRVIFFDYIYRLKGKRKLPAILKNFVSICIWIISLFLFLYLYFSYDLTGLWTTSSVTIAVLGFALRGMVMDFFSGITMGVERPLEIGDWIETDDGIVGCVDSISWRVTKIVTHDNVIKVLPNSLLASVPFRNYGKDRYFREKIEFQLDYNITGHRAERILTSAANLIPEVQKAKEAPSVKIKEFTSDGVKWELRFWLKDYKNKDNMIYKVQRNILRNLHFSGIIPPIEKDDDARFLLREIDFFDSLSDSEIEDIAKASIKKLVLQNSTVIKVHDEGDSLFLLLEGALSVFIENEKGKTVEVAKIMPGDFFGEMSLLTGEPRSATVKADVDSIIYEIKQEHIKPIIQKREDILESLTKYLFDRKTANKDICEHKHKKEIKHEQENILGKLKKLFMI